MERLLLIAAGIIIAVWSWNKLNEMAAPVRTQVESGEPLDERVKRALQQSPAPSASPSAPAPAARPSAAPSAVPEPWNYWVVRANWVEDSNGTKRRATLPFFVVPKKQSAGVPWEREYEGSSILHIDWYELHTHPKSAQDRRIQLNNAHAAR